MIDEQDRPTPVDIPFVPPEKSWDILAKFCRHACDLAVFEREMAQCFEARNKASRQMADAVKRKDDKEAWSHYARWVKKWHRIEQLKQQHSDAAAQAAQDFAPPAP